MGDQALTNPPRFFFIVTVTTTGDRFSTEHFPTNFFKKFPLQYALYIGSLFQGNGITDKIAARTHRIV